MERRKSGGKQRRNLIDERIVLSRLARVFVKKQGNFSLLRGSSHPAKLEKHCDA